MVADVGVVEDVGVVVVEVEEAKVKEEGEVIKEIREVKEEETRVRDIPGTRPRDMRTCPRSRPASGTGPMAKVLISVLSQRPVHGKIILFQSLITKPEKLTSSAKKKIYKIYFIRLFRK